MAAGFSIKTENIEIFSKKINYLSKKLLTNGILQKSLSIDCNLDFSMIDFNLLKEISLFDPTGMGNREPVFVTCRVSLLDVRFVGKENKHLKLKLKQDEHIFDSIYFGGGEMYSKLSPGSDVDIVYTIESNTWNGYKNLQLKIKDIR